MASQQIQIKRKLSFDLRKALDMYILFILYKMLISELTPISFTKKDQYIHYIFSIHDIDFY